MWKFPVQIRCVLLSFLLSITLLSFSLFLSYFLSSFLPFFLPFFPPFMYLFTRSEILKIIAINIFFCFRDFSRQKLYFPMCYQHGGILCKKKRPKSLESDCPWVGHSTLVLTSLVVRNGKFVTGEHGLQISRPRCQSQECQFQLSFNIFEPQISLL